ncbi:hypothetical protein Y1Q_0006710 [Alligator mississippiensis]|uniref:Centrosomin N-terminal motif 1 domain-containing protein n=1 Tax=Alligator mississippiensis TaxID=8496 RepID=A0A151NSL8_ALLMI|nr:hypothetical protein Y1Q_0006710 [Alligator mississippiensis]
MRGSSCHGDWCYSFVLYNDIAQGVLLCRDYCSDNEKAMVPRASHMTAFLGDAPEQGLLAPSEEDPPRQTPMLEDCEMSRCPGQAQTLPGLDQSPLMQTHLLSGPLVQTQTLRDFEKLAERRCEGTAEWLGPLASSGYTTCLLMFLCQGFHKYLVEHLNDLKKENFSLKLRIYFLEERMQQKYEASREDVYKRNIELKVEVESLKRELQEKQQVLDKTWVAAESLTNRNEAELRRQYEERQQESEHVYELLENKVQLLQEEARLAKSEAEKTAALAEVEKERCQELTEKLKEISRKEEEARKAQVLLDNYCAALAQKNKTIEELTQNLSAKEQLIELLSTEKQNLLQRLEEPKEMEVQLGHCTPG